MNRNNDNITDETIDGSNSVETGDEPSDLTMDLDSFLRQIAQGPSEGGSLEIMVPQEKLFTLIAAAGETEKYRDLALRARADYANYQRRIIRDAEESRERKVRELVESLIPVIESFYLASTGGPDWSKDAVVEGMKLAFGQLMDVLKRFGLERIDSSGKQLDVNYHEAVAKIPTDEHPPMTIIQEVRPGFLFKGRTIRPSHVVVAVETSNVKKTEGE